MKAPFAITLLKSDVRQILTASIVLAMQVHFAGGSRNTEYLRGYLAAAQATAIALGLDWKLIVDDCQAQLGVDFEVLFSETRTLEGGSHGSRH